MNMNVGAPTLAPLRRDPQLPPGNTWRRWLTARAVGAYRHVRPMEVAADMWPSDRALELVMRASSAPAQIGVAGWAAEISHTVVMDALAALGPASAAAQLLRRCTVLAFDGNGVISAPAFVAGAGNAGFVAEGTPIPVRQLADEVVQMMPNKLAAIAVLSEEMVLSSNAEQLIGDVLIRSAAAALDVALLGTAAATAAQPAGLRAGIVALTPSSDPAGAWEQYFEDAAALINSIAQVGGNGPFVLLANPGRVVNMRLRALGDPDDPFAIYGSTAMGLDLMAVAPDALIAAMSPVPEIEVANASTLHMDSAPADIVTSAGVVSAAHKSMWQTATVALRMRWPCTWALRDPRGVAWLTPNWK